MVAPVGKFSSSFLLFGLHFSLFSSRSARQRRLSPCKGCQNAHELINPQSKSTDYCDFIEIEVTANFIRSKVLKWLRHWKDFIEKTQTKIFRQNTELQSLMEEIDWSSPFSPEAHQSPEQSVCVCFCVSLTHTLPLILCFTDMTGFKTWLLKQYQLRCISQTGIRCAA